MSDKSKSKPWTRVFEYRGLIGIRSSFDAEGLLNKPQTPGQMGFVVKAEFVEMPQEALDLLKKVKKSRDCIGDVDVFDSSQGVIFSWMGGQARVICIEEDKASRDFNPDLLEGVVKIVKNEPPDDFIAYVDGAYGVEEETQESQENAKTDKKAGSD